MDTNSIKNQDIKSKFVQREVLTCFSYEMDAIFNTYDREGPKLPMWEDIENSDVYVCPECGHQQNNQDEDLYGGFCNPECDDGDDQEKEFKCPSCKKSFDEEPENQLQEIFEWWIVTEFLYKELKKRNEPVLEWGNSYYWGRTTTGQAIMMDGVINSICFQMEILHGQRYDWGKS